MPSSASFLPPLLVLYPYSTLFGSGTTGRSRNRVACTPSRSGACDEGGCHGVASAASDGSPRRRARRRGEAGRVSRRVGGAHPAHAGRRRVLGQGVVFRPRRFCALEPRSSAAGRLDHSRRESSFDRCLALVGFMVT